MSRFGYGVLSQIRAQGENGQDGSGICCLWIVVLISHDNASFGIYQTDFVEFVFLGGVSLNPFELYRYVWGAFKRCQDDGFDTVEVKLFFQCC